MPSSTFNDVLIDGNQDTTQLRVQANATQTQPLQTWENDGGTSVLSKVTADGRVQIGDDLGLATPDSLLEAHRAETSTTKPKRGFHSLGKITNLVSDVVNWAVAELVLLGTAGVSGLQSAFRGTLTHNNTGSSTSAELRAGDFQSINQTGTSGARVGQVTGVRGTASNTPSGANAYLNKAVGVEATVTNAAGGDISQASAFEVTAPTNAGTIGTLYGLRVPDLNSQNQPGVTNYYALYTGDGTVHLGDFIEVKQPTTVPGTPATSFVRVYPKSDGKLYAKDWNGNEYDLTTGTLADGSVTTVKIANGAVTLAKMAVGTPGALLGYDASGNPTQVLPGSTGQILTSNGPGQPPSMQAAPSSIPSGSMTAFAGSAAPSGWLLCDGSAVSRTTYAALYGVIANTFGADGTLKTRTSNTAGVITLTGGNRGITTSELIDLFWFYVATISSVNTTSEVITTASAHNFATGDQVRLTTTNAVIGGTTVTNSYFVRALSTTTLALYNTLGDANADTNRVNLTSAGNGTQQVVGLGVHTKPGCAISAVSGSDITFSGSSGDVLPDQGVVIWAKCASNKFLVPDLRGRVGVGYDAMGGNAASRYNARSYYGDGNVGAFGGEAEHALTLGELATHAHGFTGQSHAVASGSGVTTYELSQIAVTLSAGQERAHNNLPPFAVLNHIIKT